MKQLLFFLVLLTVTVGQVDSCSEFENCPVCTKQTTCQWYVTTVGSFCNAPLSLRGVIAHFSDHRRCPGGSRASKGSGIDRNHHHLHQHNAKSDVRNADVNTPLDNKPTQRPFRQREYALMTTERITTATTTTTTTTPLPVVNKMVKSPPRIIKIQVNHLTTESPPPSSTRLATVEIPTPTPIMTYPTEHSSSSAPFVEYAPVYYQTTTALPATFSQGPSSTPTTSFVDDDDAMNNAIDVMPNPSVEKFLNIRQHILEDFCRTHAKYDQMRNIFRGNRVRKFNMNRNIRRCIRMMQK